MELEKIKCKAAHHPTVLTTVFQAVVSNMLAGLEISLAHFYCLSCKIISQLNSDLHYIWQPGLGLGYGLGLGLGFCQICGKNEGVHDLHHCHVWDCKDPSADSLCCILFSSFFSSITTVDVNKHNFLYQLGGQRTGRAQTVKKKEQLLRGSSAPFYAPLKPRELKLNSINGIV